MLKNMKHKKLIISFDQYLIAITYLEGERVSVENQINFTRIKNILRSSSQDCVDNFELWHAMNFGICFVIVLNIKRIKRK